MAGFSQRLIRLWNEWQLGGLVLLSMLLQLLLLATARYRRRWRPYARWKAFFWIVHIGAKFLPTYCLGILSKATARNANADLEAFWASILLFHLSGVDDFTALTLEDNKLWPRHGAILLSQAGSAAYVFFHYFLDPGSGPLLLPFVMVFVASFVKCVEQVCALSHGKIEALWASVVGDPDPGPDFDDTMDQVNAKYRKGCPVCLDFHWESSVVEQRATIARSPSTMHASPRGSQNPPTETTARHHHHHIHISEEHAETSVFASGDRPTARDFYMQSGGVHARWEETAPSTSTMPSTSSRQQSDSADQCEIMVVDDAAGPSNSNPPMPASATLGTLSVRTPQETSETNDPESVCRGHVASATTTCTLISLCASGEVPPNNSDTMSATIRSAHKLFSTFKVVFADGIFSFKDRRFSQEVFRGKDAEWAFKVIDVELSLAYDMLYTKASVSSATVGLLIRGMSLVLTLASSLLILFSTVGDSKYRLKHKGITYALLLGALLVDVVILVDYIRSDWSLVGNRSPACCHRSAYKARWSESMAQYNLIAFCVSSLPPPCPIQSCLSNLLGHSLLKKVGLLDFLDNMRSIQYVGVTKDLKDTIFEELKNKVIWAIGYDDYYKRFTISRGDWVLGHGMEGEGRHSSTLGLGWSIEGSEFDESLLMWHIATDLCYRSEIASEMPIRDDEIRKHRDVSRTLSNYLVYIMVAHPLMLSSSTIMATKRLKDTCAELRRFLLKHPDPLDEPSVHAALLEVDTPLRASVVKGDKSMSVLWDGCYLAKELQVMREAKWEIICKVWVEMLCYAGIQCGGYYHAEELRDGGEMLTFACFLMTHLGMGKHYMIEVGEATADFISPDE
ncbi:hypothetical protein HU200_032183 [Digitaria exilis]|uniref:DUF4220 domain-containing protein n=1 Tax=Digitaria exilis TaxID=1010633 RepID=A0A835BX75_9POAL|nr:hypothetical protein HU200_032183 [Digitaria exilis]